ncbi:MAG: nitroreductase family protein [Candidatus Methanomethylicia archaeon]
MDVFEAILKRRSIRRYLDKPVEAEKILKCLEAARWAPSAHNSQPWHFIIVRDRETREKLASIHPFGKHMAYSPIVLVVLADPEKSPIFWQNDVGAAVQNILLTAFSEGLGSCWIGVQFTPFEEEFKKILKIPEKFRVVCAITIGYPAHERTSTRVALEDIVSVDFYGNKLNMEVFKCSYK